MHEVPAVDPGTWQDQAVGQRTGSRGRVATAAVLVVLVAELLVRVASPSLPEPQVWSTPEVQYKVGLMRDHPPVTVALVGSSVVDVSIDPEQLGSRAFNAALGAASIGMVADFTRAVVIPELDPDVVVLGVASRELNANAPEQADLERRFRDAPAVREVLGTESLLERVARRAADVSALVEHRSVLRDPRTWLGRAPPDWGPALTAGSGLYLGFLEESYRSTDGTGQRLGAAAVRDFTVGDAQVAALRSLVADLRAQGRQVLLLATPVTADYVALHPRGGTDHDAFVQQMAAIAAETGARFVDAGVWDDHHFADPLHVNRAGVERLTALVRAELEHQNWK